MAMTAPHLGHPPRDLHKIMFDVDLHKNVLKKYSSCYYKTKHKPMKKILRVHYEYNYIVYIYYTSV